ncbi:MAG: PssD/Cps14F family polysaccharide biosynthesis glycosyltransferase [archaeon]|jgi:UDP-N-acetylglucosamine:LPS N-acetylglucosamine transferase
MKKIKICIAASSGGHLKQALRLSDIWKDQNYFFITERRCNGLDLAKKERTYFITPARRKVHRLIMSFLQTIRIFLLENPDAIISTGAEIGFPPVIIGFLLRKKIIYLETFARIDDLSLTGKLLYPLIKNFFVQWEPLKKKYPKAIYLGAVY